MLRWIDGRRRETNWCRASPLRRRRTARPALPLQVNVELLATLLKAL